MARLEAQDAAQWLESARNEVNEFAGRWKDRLALDNPRLFQRYVDNELRIHVHIRGVEEYCAIFQSTSLGWPEAKAHASASIVGNVPIGGDNIDIVHLFEAAERRDQQVMFVSNVELVQLPQRVSCPSLVRFDKLDVLHDMLPRSPFYSRETGYELIGVVGNREVDSVMTDFAIRDIEAAHRIVESGPQVMDQITNDSAHGQGDRLSSLKLKQVVAGLRVSRSGNAVGVAFAKIVPRRFQFADVMLGPFDLFSDTSQIVRHEADSLYERQEDAEDPEELRDSDPDTGRVLRQSEEDREAAQRSTPPAARRRSTPRTPFLTSDQNPAIAFRMDIPPLTLHLLRVVDAVVLVSRVRLHAVVL